MDFGHVEPSQLAKTDFTLAADPVFNNEVLPGKTAAQPAIYVGCAKWGRSEWVGKIYPPGTRESRFLDHYLQHFNSIELNLTHYKIVGPAGVQKWADKAGERDFRYCPKMYQGVTHKGRLPTKQFLTNEFIRGVRAFGPHLGPILIQFSETFGPKRKQELIDYLARLPRDLSFAVELRHRDWFRKAPMWEEIGRELRALNMTLVITDTSDRRDCVHMHLTNATAFIRFAGNNLHLSDYRRIDEWVLRIRNWLNRGLEGLYFFMHMQDETDSPELAAYLADKLNKTLGLSLPVPRFL